ncbi:uncharacterized protein N7469_006855 [Penicillium citrinum]|uniref:Uncharacterized protein n=1 Tax=Penicillium citrinum TaxID=5077 RepID=A0A9W9TLE3_PENCI|nr:uncharacterized protein N7469_006855 [Penicillium citrinum]KAJ5226849.1 hypothetical protein N7469_006855 [Penicillium citrinum]
MDDMELPSYREGSSLAVVPDSVNIPPRAIRNPPHTKSQHPQMSKDALMIHQTSNQVTQQNPSLGREIAWSILKIAPITSVVLWFSV